MARKRRSFSGAFKAQVAMAAVRGEKITVRMRITRRVPWPGIRHPSGTSRCRLRGTS